MSFLQIRMNSQTFEKPSSVLCEDYQLPEAEFAFVTHPMTIQDQSDCGKISMEQRNTFGIN